MTASPVTRTAAALAAAAVLAFCLGTAGAQEAHELAKPLVKQPPACAAPNDLIRLDHVLPRAAARMAAGEPLTIVAIGSSSTAGAGASSPDKSYPARLAAELRALLPRMTVNVVNRGVNGETATDMLARFNDEVLSQKPDVVVWQVGSNSLLREQPLLPVAELMRAGIKRLKAAGVDVILMNPQYAPKVIAKPHVEEMVQLMSEVAGQASVGVFQRYALMRYWKLTEEIGFETFLASDELHLNDWSYNCIGKFLAQSIIDASIRPTLTAGARRPAR